MTTMYCLYIFDTDNYAKTVKPLVSRLLLEDYSGLHELATTIALKKPDIWQELIYWRYYPDDLGNEEVEFDMPINRVDFWMTIILMANCTRIPTPEKYYEQIAEARKYCGSDRYIERILWGSPLQTFYEIMLGEVSKETNVHISKIPLWCKRGLVHWLSYTEIGKLIQWIDESKNCFSKTSNLLDTIDSAEQILLSAYQQQKDLLIATLD